MRLLTAIFLLGIGAVGQDAKAILQTLRPELEDKVLTIRQFFRNDELHYSDLGDSLNGDEGKWTIHGNVKVKDVRLRDGNLVIKADRLGVAYDTQRADIRLIRRKAKVKITLALGSAPSVEAVRGALERVFIASNAELLAAIPEYWRRILAQSSPQPATQAPAAAGVHRVGKVVSAPTVVYKPEPEYQPEAQQVNLQGVVLLQCVVGEDGNPRDLRIIRPLGMELEQQALRTVQAWKFKPGTNQEGKPVAVLVNIEVGFNLYAP